MKESNRQPGRTDPMETFRRRRNELGELVALAQQAAQTLRSRALSTYTRLSQLLDEVLPLEPAREARVAKAVSLDVRLLRQLRQGQLDPMLVPKMALAELVNALRLDRASLLRLVSADHMAFGAVAARGNAAEPDDLLEFEAALDRIALDSPDRISG